MLCSTALYIHYELPSHVLHHVCCGLAPKLPLQLPVGVTRRRDNMPGNILKPTQRVSHSLQAVSEVGVFTGLESQLVVTSDCIAWPSHFATSQFSVNCCQFRLSQLSLTLTGCSRVTFTCTSASYTPDSGQTLSTSRMPVSGKMILSLQTTATTQHYNCRLSTVLAACHACGIC